MDTIIRTHVKTDARLAILEGTVLSAIDKGLGRWGNIWIADDGSPMAAEVERVGKVCGVQVFRNDGRPSTKNGLYGALRYSKALPTLVVCDDVVFGRGIRDYIESQMGKLPTNYGYFSLFASYPDHMRMGGNVRGTEIWEYPLDCFYAGLAGVYNPKFAQIYCQKWEQVMSGMVPEPIWQDDLWVKELCRENGFKIYNSMNDYAQHTGMMRRSFGNNETEDSSNYTTAHFVGE